MSNSTGRTAASGDALTTTRDTLHGLAEWLLAGPQYLRAGTIRLGVVNGGVETRDGRVMLSANGLVVRSTDADTRHELRGTVQTLADALGITPSIPAGVYSEHAPVTPKSAVTVDRPTAEALFEWFTRGQTGLLEFAPDEEPVLWPEHFDLGISMAGVNYGVSPGDASHHQPYAYVSPWIQRAGNFWNAHFGAVRGAAELPAPSAVAAFFSEGAGRAAQDPPN